MTGYHTYYQSRSNKKFGVIDTLVQLISILYWKEHYGEINLYCNTDFLKSSKKYGIEKEYVEINTELLDNYPYGEYAVRFWSLNKIYVAADIAKKEESFCLVDTDLWISKPNMLREDVDVLFYHKETINPTFDNTVYPDVTNWLDRNIASQLNWDVVPRNSAILCFNSNFKKLVELWEYMSIEIMKNTLNKEYTFKNKDAHTIFVEQRLIGPLAEKLGVTIGEILPNTFSSVNPQWTPELGNTPESDYVARSIKHIWGVKHMYEDPVIRKVVLEIALSAIKEVIGDRIEYNTLIEECEGLLKDIKVSEK